MKNKVIFLFIFIILFSFILSPFSLGLSFTGFDGNDYNFVDVELCDYFLIYRMSSSSSLIILRTFSILPTVTKSSGGICTYSFNGTFIECEYQFNYKTFDLLYSGKLTTRDTYSFQIDSNQIMLCANFDIVNSSDNTLLYKSNYNSVINPFIVNKEEISTGKFDKVVINSGDYIDKEFYLFSYHFSDTYESLFPIKEILLDGLQNKFLVGSSDGQYIYEVPLAYLGIDLVEGNKYGFKLAILNSEGNYEFLDDISFTIGTVTTEEKEQADRDKELALQEEQNETSKGIWETIKEIVSYLNPLSENFFVYKLIELLIEAIKSLFIPSDDFFINFATDLNEWLSERLGILYFPIDIVVTFLERVNEISESGSAVISWNDFNFMGATLINAGSYDLNSLLTNDTIKNVHSIYLVFTDVILWIGLAFLAKNVFTDIFGGKYDELEIVAGDASEAYEKSEITRKANVRSNRGVGFDEKNSVIRRK